MTLKEAREIESNLKPCKCGGQLCLGVSKHPSKNFDHFKIICRTCGAWRGGITRERRSNK